MAKKKTGKKEKDTKRLQRAIIGLILAMIMLSSAIAAIMQL
jgi:hypothetical protein